MIKNSIIALLILTCAVSIYMNVNLNRKLNKELSELKETIQYLEALTEAIVTIQAMPDTPTVKNTKKTYKPLVLEDKTLEYKIQNLEVKNREQEEKLKNIERDTFWLKYDLNHITDP